jgi:ATP-dependent protease ClpP protease subunit
MSAPKTEFRLAWANGINVDTANHLRTRIAQIIERPDFGSLTLLFSSEGGSTDQALALFSYIVSLPIPVRMHAVGHVGSAANVVFLAGTARTASPFARFFFHEYDWGFAERQTLRRIEEAAKRLRDDIEVSRQIIRSRTQAKDDILASLDGSSGPVILTLEQAKELGFITEIADLAVDGHPISVWT